MDRHLLKERALHLEQVLQVLSPRSEVGRGLQLGTISIVKAAIAGEISKPVPMGEVPCGRMLAEGDLSHEPEMERAFASLVSALTR